ncbi:hypothetical protein DL96DRAFT_104662 [Flagelloscypha sp. PMI_526]|nr:hypothetical protein DL96DRAFT_104662 [Flagelloscypha sp. PMI_526]
MVLSPNRNVDNVALQTLSLQDEKSLLPRVQQRKARISDTRPTRPSNGVKQKVRKGRLCLLPELPLDVLYEIFGHLHPVDLLHLARSTKNLRRVILTKNALSVWRATYPSPEEIPTAPEDVPLPVWCSLIFENFCQSCLAVNVRKVYFALRVRYCNKCIKNKTIPKSAFDPKVKRDKIIIQCLPFEKYGSEETRCLKATQDTLLAELNCLDGDRSQWVKERKAAARQRVKDAAPFIDWDINVKQDRQDELTDIRMERRLAIEEKISQMGYHIELDWLQTNEDIVAALDMSCWSDHPRLKDAKPLTDRIWNKLEDEIKEYMEKVRTVRVRVLRQTVIDRRKRELSKAYAAFRFSETQPDDRKPATAHALTTLWPTIFDLYRKKSLKTILEKEGDDDVTAEDFKPFFSELAKKLPLWCYSQRQDLAYSLDLTSFFESIGEWNGHWDHYSKSQYLDLAVVVVTCDTPPFWCHGCNERDMKLRPWMWYPHFLHDTCTTFCRRRHAKWDKKATESDRDSTLHVDGGHSLRITEFNTDTLTFDVKAAKIVVNLLRLCQMNPRETTVKQMDELPARFVCLKCNFGHQCDGDRRVTVMNWRAAVQHNMIKHFGDATVLWERISELDVPEAERLEVLEPHRLKGLETEYLLLAPNEAVYRCLRCRGDKADPGPKGIEVLELHLETEHGIPKGEAALDFDYYRALDLPAEQPCPVRMKPRKVEM